MFIHIQNFPDMKKVARFYKIFSKGLKFVVFLSRHYLKFRNVDGRNIREG